jgi:beta-glucosidase
MSYKNADLSLEERAKDLLARMTVREKVGQLNQKLYGFSCYERAGDEIALTRGFRDEVKKWSGLGLLYGLYRADPWSGKTEKNGITNALVPEAYNAVQKYVVSHSRLGIPVLMSSECPHGHQALGGYLLPVALAMGASFDPELVRSAFAVCAGQMKEMGVDLALISVLDVLRDPRWGRSEECFGEDPLLCACMAEAAVLGCRDKGVAAVAKHFCAQGEETEG